MVSQRLYDNGFHPFTVSPDGSMSVAALFGLEEGVTGQPRPGRPLCKSRPEEGTADQKKQHK